jgi:hypothetical protein
MLSIASTLDSQLGGASVPVHLTDKMTGRGRPGESGPLDGDNRRTMFVEVRRNFLNPFLMAFDFPMPSSTVGARNASNVPAQALGMLNDPLVLLVAQRWVDNSANLSDVRARAETMLHTAFGRKPSAAELDACTAFVDAGGDAWVELAHALLNAKEFSYLK